MTFGKLNTLHPNIKKQQDLFTAVLEYFRPLLVPNYQGSQLEIITPKARYLLINKLEIEMSVSVGAVILTANLLESN